MRLKTITGCAFCVFFLTMPNMPYGSAGAESPPVSWDPASYSQVNAKDFEQIKLKDFILLNSPWGKGSIVDYRQWVFKARSDADLPFGWKWDWPKTRVDDVKAYQSLSYGWNPWRDKASNDVLPMKIGWISELRVDYDVALNASGKYNLSFDVWITERPGNTDQKELNVKREFMVWVDRKEAGFDSHWYVGNVRIGGEEYLFYRIPDLKGTLSSRDFMVFIKAKPMLKGSIDLEDFLAYMLKKKYLTEEEYFRNIDFGDEVWYGQGEATVNGFDVTLTTK